jgi:hypothetical protein
MNALLAAKRSPVRWGQPNVPECAVGFLFLCLYAAKISLSFCHQFVFLQ